MGCCDDPIKLGSPGSDGNDGISAYVYIAYADDVTLADPDVVTGFSYETPQPTSCWLAIKQTNTPISSPAAADFEDLWVKICGEDGVGAAGIQVSLNGTVVVDPTTNINFIPAGLTGISVVDAGSGIADVNVVTAGLVKIYRTDLIAAAGTYVPGAYYWVVDVGDGDVDDMDPAGYGLVGAAFTSYDHKGGIILRAITDSVLDSQGIYLARVIDRNTYPSLFTPGTAYTQNTSVVENFNELYLLTGTTGSYTLQPAEDSANWDFLYKDDDTYYVTEIQGCQYDITSDFISARWDKRNNVLRNVNWASPLYNELIKKAFRWGYFGYSNNKINFVDNLNKTVGERIPDYETTPYCSLVNYSNINTFNNNNIDLDLAANVVDTYDFTTGTRFFNNNLQTSNLQSNTINNSVIANIDDLNTAFYITGNKISNSIINNINITSLLRNEISNSALGDLYYNNTFNGYSSNGTIPFRLINDDANSVPNNAIIYNLGSKNWTSSGSTSDITVTTDTVVAMSGAGSNTTYAEVGDIVEFVASGTLNGLYFPVDSINSATSFTILDTSGVTTLATNVSLRLYYPSIKTSFSSFYGNKIEFSVIRGLNKDVQGTTNFNLNNIRYSYIENYEQHIDTAETNFLTYYSLPGNEFGVGSDPDGFSRNIIEDSVLLNNKTTTFIDNKIKGAYIISNNTLGGKLGFSGGFSNNTLLGAGHSQTDAINNSSRYAYNSYDITPSIFISTNSFAANSIFNSNIIDTHNSIGLCTLGASSRITGCKLFGKTGNNPTSGLTLNSIPTAGFYNVSVTAGTYLTDIVLEGNGCSFTNLNITTALTKEFGIYPGYPTALDGVLFRDIILDGLRNGGNYTFTPNLLASRNNPIRDINTISEVATAATPLGTGTFDTATFEMTVVTHQPHGYNLEVGAIDETVLYLYGVNINMAGDYNTGPSAPAADSFYYKGGNTLSGIQFPATITSIVDEYTFVCEISQDASGLYLLSNTNTETADYDRYGFGTAHTGTGINYYAGGSTIFDDTKQDWVFNEFLASSRYDKTNTSTSPAYNSMITKGISDVVTKVHLGLTYPAAAIPNTATGSRNYYLYADYEYTTTKIYDTATNTLTLPLFIDQLFPTLQFHTHDGSAPYDIDFIEEMGNNRLYNMPIRLITTPGCEVVLNLVAAATNTANTIIQDSAATTYTLKAYYNGTNVISDEIVIVREFDSFKILSKIIHQ